MHDHDLDFRRKREYLVKKLIEEGILKSSRVIKAMLRVPREEFVLEEYKKYAYVDTPLPILCNQTISAPHMVALMCERAELDVGHKVLEIGTGSGYHAAVIAEIVAPIDEPKEKWGHVYTVERIKELVNFAYNNLKKTGYLNRVTVIHGDGTLGYPKEAPYDRIIVTAAAPKVPEPLLKQLKNGGILVIPVGPKYLQRLVIVKRISDDKFQIIEDTPCAFVPLIGRYGWKDEFSYY